SFHLTLMIVESASASPTLTLIRDTSEGELELGECPEIEEEDIKKRCETFRLKYYHYKNSLEFIIIEIRDNWLMYENSTRYKNELRISRKVLLSNAVVSFLIKMFEESNVANITIDPRDKSNSRGTQHLEVGLDDQYHTFEIMHLVSIHEASKCASEVEHIKDIHYFILDLLQFLVSVISMHFNEDPFSNSVDNDD
ncbi:MAG: hypothetical protein MHMPM18_003854, partial [Marteilia pararefringens]